MGPQAIGQAVKPLLNQYVVPALFNIEAVLSAVKTLNDLADKARAEGWTVEFVGADYIAADVKKTQKGNGPNV